MNETVHYLVDRPLRYLQGGASVHRTFPLSHRG